MLKKLVLLATTIIGITLITPTFSAVVITVGPDKWQNWKWREDHRSDWKKWHKHHRKDWMEWREKDRHDWDRWCYYHPYDCR